MTHFAWVILRPGNLPEALVEREVVSDRVLPGGKENKPMSINSWEITTKRVNKPLLTHKHH